MARRVVYSFHYKPDNSRAAQVRNMGVVEGNKPASDNDWEAVTKGGDDGIEQWIDEQMDSKSCVVVLVGRNTAGRKWITHEIVKGWNAGKEVLGVYVHNLKDLDGEQSMQGSNPFDSVTMKRDDKKLSSFAKAYNPPFSDSKEVYAHIKRNLANWIEEAITIRENY